MTDDPIYQALGKLTEEMYFSLAKTQSVQMQDQLLRYHALAENKISQLIDAISRYHAGEIIHSQQQKIRIFRDDFNDMKNDINSKYKIYIRGCGNAGKSTLLNALLSLDESTGSRMGRVPVTFIIDTYTDEFAAGEARVRKIRKDGTSTYEKVTRAQAVAMEDREEKDFSESADRCRQLIREKTQNVFLKQEREDIEQDIFKQHLLQTDIREIRWGIGNNHFFHNCILIDTPGLSQELRFTNVIEDVKNYEVDGIIWVISSETLAKQEVIDSYQEEFRKMHEIYTGKKVIAVINMYGSTADFHYGSRLWKRVEKKARQIYCKRGGFDDLICVNAKMAYDGNVKADQELADKSNISELRQKINELFVEKSSEAYHYARLDKIDAFLDNLYREVDIYKKSLHDFVQQYEKKKDPIAVQSSICRNIVKEEKAKTYRRCLADINSRIELNFERIQNLDQEPADVQERFINDQIVKTGILQRELYDAVDRCGQLVYERFKDQQTKSIISSYKTQQFACQAFGRMNDGMLMDNGQVNMNIRLKPGIVDSILEGFGSMLTDIFGVNNVTKGIQGLLRQMGKLFASPQDKLRRTIEKQLGKAVDVIDLSDHIAEYERICVETLDRSMEQTCGRYVDVQELISDMEQFLLDRPQMEWEKTGLRELLGGTGNV